MKKLLLLIMVSIFSLNVYAHGGASAIRGVRWTPVNIVAFPIALFDPEETEVYGVLFSPGFGASKEVYGINSGIVTAVLENSYGISLNIVSVALRHHGVSIGVVNMGYNDGISAGIFTIGGNRGIILGLCNLVIDNDGISLGVINLLENNAGVSIGLVNRMIAGGGKSSGTSVGVANISKKNTFQLGIYNQAEGGLQIGLLNYNPNAAIPWLPFFNYSSDTEDKKQK